MTKRILIIDNEQYIQEVIQICLQTTAGWQVMAVSSGRDGIAKAEVEQPDAILLDVMMPDMDGLTTFQVLQDHPDTRPIPVILLTAKVQSSDRCRYEELGVKGTIAKPFDPLELASQVATILGWSL
ncbi:MAG: response regulator [Leptolyngbyaceae cyanobacterium CRU_2_3]|nr:response regulator [Leptolyngbyaceae cyanobacterium CRU_2_3]